MDEVAFVDPSPLIALAGIRRADLLRSVAGRVVVPAAVEREIRAHSGDSLTPMLLREATWIVTGTETEIPTVISSWDLGSGESAVLALASQTPSAVAVIDDLAARHCAVSIGIGLMGTVGVVLRAKRRGAIGAARPVLGELRAAGLYLSDELVERALRDVAE